MWEGSIDLLRVHSLYWGLNPQPRHVLSSGIKPITCQFMEQHSNQPNYTGQAWKEFNDSFIYRSVDKMKGTNKGCWGYPVGSYYDFFFPPISHPRFYPPLALSMCPLYMFLDDPSPYSPVILSHLPSGYCQIVLYFNVSSYILPACLFCWLGSTYRWDHMVFVPHRLAYFT